MLWDKKKTNVEEVTQTLVFFLFFVSAYEEIVNLGTCLKYAIFGRYAAQRRHGTREETKKVKSISPQTAHTGYPQKSGFFFKR